jgi:hypothetical protein
VLQVKVNFFQLFAELWQKGLREKGDRSRQIGSHETVAKILKMLAELT